MRTTCIAFAIALLMTLPLSAGAATWYVKADGSGDAPTIQAGIDIAAVGDIVLLAPGTYTGPGNKDLDFGGKDIVLRSESGPEVTIIDCEGSGRGFYFHNGESPEAVVEGLSVRNASAVEAGSGARIMSSSPTIVNCTFSANAAPWYGGGMSCLAGSSPVLIDCRFFDNSAIRGGGLYCGDSSPTITGCTFSGNSAVDNGGGMHLGISSPELTDCVFSANTGSLGGALHCENNCFPMLTDCTFSGNTAEFAGAGIYCYYYCSPTLTSCTLSGNTTPEGGGISCHFHCSPTLTDCVFSGNVATASVGGGMWCTDESSPTLTNCAFTGNSANHHGGGIGIRTGSSPLLTGCSFLQNSASLAGGALYCALASADLQHCIFSGNAAPGWMGGAIMCTEDASVVITNCTMSGNLSLRGAGVACYENSSAVLENSIIAFSPLGHAVFCWTGSSITLGCCDVYCNAGGDWVGCIDGQLGVNGNISEHPLFCDRENGDFTLRSNSPCLPGNYPECGLIGALGEGCPAAIPSGSIDGRVVADCPESETGLLGVLIDAYEVETGDLVGSTVTDETGDYSLDNLDFGEYMVTIVTPLGYSAAAEEVPVTVTGCEVPTLDFSLTCLDITANPRSMGFWKHQVGVATSGRGNAQIGAAELCGYLDLIEIHFNSNEINPVAVYVPPSSGDCQDKLLIASDLLNLRGSVAMIARAKQQLVALLLNVAGERISLGEVVSEDGATVSQAITFCDNLIDDPDGDHELAKTIADDVNNGRQVGSGLIPLDTPEIAYGPPTIRSGAELGHSNPNPADGATVISYVVPTPGAYVVLEVYDVAGRHVRTLVMGYRKAGPGHVVWHGDDESGCRVTSGVYFYRMQIGAWSGSRRIVFLR